MGKLLKKNPDKPYHKNGVWLENKITPSQTPITKVNNIII